MKDCPTYRERVRMLRTGVSTVLSVSRPKDRCRKYNRPPTAETNPGAFKFITDMM